jgi:leader peptidase (prepilin peptidase) / N-methyltransferase
MDNKPLMENLIPNFSPLAGTILGGVFGLMVGSFFNVVIYRMPRGESVVWPPSRCTSCGYQIKFYQNVPVLSWLMLRGKCRSCHAKISAEYPIVESITGLVAALIFAWIFRAGTESPLDFKIAITYLGLASIPIFIIDFRHFLIPDLLSITGIVFGLAISFLPGGLTPLESLTGAAVAGFFLWVVGALATWYKKKDAMGLGDVKLIAMCGALFGLETAMFGLVFASFLGSLVGIPMLLFRRLNENHHIPFGPYICLGVLLAAFFGKMIFAWYLGFLSH